MTEQEIRELIYNESTNNNVEYNSTQQGWVCPRCGKVNAPWMPHCTCNPDEQRVTYKAMEE